MLKFYELYLNCTIEVVGRYFLSCKRSTGVSSLSFIYASRAGISCFIRLFVGEPVVMFFVKF